jgi:hypothetical protein
MSDAEKDKLFNRRRATVFQKRASGNLTLFDQLKKTNEENENTTSLPNLTIKTIEDKIKEDEEQSSMPSTFLFFLNSKRSTCSWSE